jgi:superkiller protein 3
MALALCAGVILGALVLTARAQTTVWRDGASLWTHAIACTASNSFAHSNLAYAYAAEGKEDAAIAEYQKTLAIDPNYPDASFNLGQILLRRGRSAEAAAQYQNALKIQPNDPDAQKNLARALVLQGEIDAALARLGKTNDANLPPEARCLSLGNDFLQKGEFTEAIACYRQAATLNPKSADALASLGMALSENGAIKDAIAAWQRALEVDANLVLVENNLAWLLSTTPDKSLRDGAQAVALAARANDSAAGANPLFQQTLAAAYAEQGNYPRAAATARNALDLATAQKNNALIPALQNQIKLYDSGAPLWDAPK